MNDKVSELKMSVGKAHNTSMTWGNLDLENCSGITQLNIASRDNSRLRKKEIFFLFAT